MARTNGTHSATNGTRYVKHKKKTPVKKKKYTKKK